MTANNRVVLTSQLQIINKNCSKASVSQDANAYATWWQTSKPVALEGEVNGK